MSDEQSHDHQPDQSCRDAGDTPEDVDAWLECREEHATSDESISHANGRVPELEDAYCHVEAEEVEGTLVAMPDAGLRPHAVVV